MTVRLAAFALTLMFACNKEEAAPVADKKPAPTASVQKDADLTAKTWAGKVHSSAGEMTFKSTPGGLTAEMAYQIFGRVVITDQFTVTRAPDGTITLKGSPTNKLIGGGRFPLAELVGKMSEDKTTIGGTHTLPQGEIVWFVTTKQSVKEIDPPLDTALAEKALTEAPWEGTLGNKPIKVTFAKKDKLTGQLISGKDKTALDVTVDGTGQVRMVAAPKATQQGLLNEIFNGHFGTAELKKISGTEEAVVKQGFVEQSNSLTFTIERQEAAPAKGKKKAK